MSKSILVAVVTAAVVLGGVTLLRAEPVASKAKWEYKVVMGPRSLLENGGPKFETTMNELAGNGWEYEAQFVGDTDPFVLLKRVK